LTVLAEASWYTHVSLQGRVVAMRDDSDFADIDRLSTHYNGRPFPNRAHGRVSAWIEIDHWHSWGAITQP
jgi:hypothetical protein